MEIELIRSRRKTLALQVRRDLSVVVRAPHRVSKREIQRFVEKHLSWIETQRNRIRAAASEEPEVPPLSEDELRTLKEAARRDLTARVERFAPLVGVGYGRIAIRRQRTKWGSCSSKGNLNFNCLLMLAPEAVRDYVVVHELCHRRQMNHSPSFWAEAERVLPDYRKAKTWLRREGGALMRRIRDD